MSSASRTGSWTGCAWSSVPTAAPALADLGQARVAATRVPLMSDRAHVLVTMALKVGDQRAIEATAMAIGNDGLAEILPFLQPAVFDRVTLHAIKEQDWSLGDLSDRAADVAGIEPPKLERIRRVTVRSLLLAAGIALFAYWFIASLAGIDINDVVNELKSADKTWLWTALILTPAVQLPQAFSTIGASREAVRYGPVLMLQYSIQFIQLAVPSSAARVALEIRFFQRMGIEVGGATSIGIIDSVSGFVIQIDDDPHHHALRDGELDAPRRLLVELLLVELLVERIVGQPLDAPGRADRDRTHPRARDPSIPEDHQGGRAALPDDDP